MSKEGEKDDTLNKTDNDAVFLEPHVPVNPHANEFVRMKNNDVILTFNSFDYNAWVREAEEYKLRFPNEVRRILAKSAWSEVGL